MKEVFDSLYIFANSNPAGTYAKYACMQLNACTYEYTHVRVLGHDCRMVNLTSVRRFPAY